MKKKNSSNLEKWEDLLDFAQSYMGSAIKLVNCHGSKPDFKTFSNYDKAYILSAHFLMAHGVELYLKFLICLLGGMPSNSHKLKGIMNELNPWYQKYYGNPILNSELRKEIDILDRNEQFRYPFNAKWEHIPDIVNKESQEWNSKYANTRANKWIQIKDHLNYTGYSLTQKLILCPSSNPSPTKS